MTATAIRGFWVIEVDCDGRKEMSQGACIDAYYGYSEPDRCITIDGLILRGNKRQAESLAREFSRVWAQQDASYSYYVRPLLADDYFGAYHARAVEFTGGKLAE